MTVTCNKPILVFSLNSSMSFDAFCLSVKSIVMTKDGSVIHLAACLTAALIYSINIHRV